MDTLNHLASIKNQLEKMVCIVGDFSNVIGIQFGLEKCRILNIIKKQIQPSGFDKENVQYIEAIGTYKVCKCLDVNKVRKTDNRTVKIELTTKLIKRVKQVLKTHLYSKSVF